MELEGWINKTVRVFYSDGIAVSRKDGKLIAVGNDFISIERGEGGEAIPVTRVIRIESGGRD